MLRIGRGRRTEPSVPLWLNGRHAVEWSDCWTQDEGRFLPDAVSVSNKA